MRRLWTIVFVLVLVGLMLPSCERRQTVQAGSEGTTNGDYQPRPAPETGADVSKTPWEIKGEIRSIDVAAKTMIIRVDNGMDQTFKWNDETTLLGMTAAGDTGVMKAAKSAKLSETAANMTELARRGGSDVSVQWKDDSGMKLATSINVTNMTSLKKLTRPRHRSKR